MASRNFPTDFGHVLFRLCFDLHFLWVHALIQTMMGTKTGSKGVFQCYRYPEAVLFWVVESGFAGPIIVLVQEFEENFSTKPGFPKQTWGSCQFWNLHRNCLLSSWHMVDAEKSWFPRENHLQYISVDWRATEAASRWSSKEFDALRLGLWRFVYWIPGGDCCAMAAGLERCVVLLGRVWILRRSAKWAFHKKQFMGQAQIYRCYSISSIPTHGYTWENMADSFIVLQAGV